MIARHASRLPKQVRQVQVRMNDADEFAAGAMKATNTEGMAAWCELAAAGWTVTQCDGFVRLDIKGEGWSVDVELSDDDGQIHCDACGCYDPPRNGFVMLEEARRADGWTDVPTVVGELLRWLAPLANACPAADGECEPTPWTADA